MGEKIVVVVGIPEESMHTSVAYKSLNNMTNHDWNLIEQSRMVVDIAWGLSNGNYDGWVKVTGNYNNMDDKLCNIHCLYIRVTSE